MKCQNCGKEKREHVVSIDSNRKKKLKNVVLWCYPISNAIKPTDKRYMMKFLECVEGEQDG